MDIRSYRPVPYGWSDWYESSWVNLNLHIGIMSHISARIRDGYVVDQATESADRMAVSA